MDDRSEARGGDAPLIRDGLEAWEQNVLAVHLKESPEVREFFHTGSGEFEVKPLYTPLDTGDEIDEGDERKYLETQGFPGSFPFTRGRRAGGHRTFPWKLGYYSGFGSAGDTNKRMRKLVEGGAGYVTLAMDLPSQCGYDPDHSLGRDDVGKVGVSVSSLRDVEEIYDGVPLDRVGTGTVGNCIAPIMVGLFSAVAERKGLDPGAVAITLQNDPLKEFTGRGTQIVPVGPSLELAADVVEFCIRSRRRWIPQYACTTQLRWGGVTASEEIAFGVANFAAYVDAVVRRGLRPEDVVSRMEGLHMTADNDLFEEVAKFRATRRLWAKFSRERYNTDDPRVLGLKLTTFTGAHRLTAQQPLNNLTRTAMHVLASLLGGVERLSIPAYDEALALPTEESTRIANLSKMIVLYESGIANTVDPLAGSYYVESLTDALEAKAADLLDTIEAAGGAVDAIRNGVYEGAMITGLKAESDTLENGTRTVVGVNAFRVEQDQAPVLFKVDEAYRDRHIRHLETLRNERDQESVAASLARLRDTLQRKAEGEAINSVPAFSECVQAYATVGEMGEVMRRVFGPAQGTAA